MDLITTLKTVPTRHTPRTHALMATGFVMAGAALYYATQDTTPNHTHIATLLAVASAGVLLTWAYIVMRRNLARQVAAGQILARYLHEDHHVIALEPIDLSLTLRVAHLDAITNDSRLAHVAVRWHNQPVIRNAATPDGYDAVKVKITTTGF